MGDHDPPCIGLVVNPIAGIGGAVGLKGSDGQDLAEAARRLGGRSPAGDRARDLVVALGALKVPIALVTGPGELGADHLAATAVAHRTVGRLAQTPSSAHDTIRIARELAEGGCDLLVFVGGDGTARDILDAVGQRVPVLGVPSGVKMHSAVFARSVRWAAEIVAAFVRGRTGTTAREVMDIDEERVRAGQVSARLYGVLDVPDQPRLLQGAKAGSRGGSDVDGIAAQLASEMRADVRYVLGPGTTVQAVAAAFGVTATLLGVDVVQDREVIARDAAEREIFRLVGDHAAEIIVSITGGQGYVLGRGNQQISPRVVRAVGLHRLRVVAAMDKLVALSAPLRVDTGDQALDDELAGYRRVTTGFRRDTMWMVEP